MDDFTYYAVTYTIDGGPQEYRMQCMTVEGETTTDDFPKMIGITALGSPEEGEERITVIKYAEQTRRGAK